MLNLIKAVGRWLVRMVLTFVLISAVLVAGYWVQDKVREYQSLKGELAVLVGGRAEIGKRIREFEQSAAAEVERLSKSPGPALDRRIGELDNEIQQLTARQADDGMAVLTAVPLGSGYVEHLKRDVEIKLLRQQREHLARMRNSLTALRDGPAALERLHKIRVSAHEKLSANYAAFKSLQDDRPWATRIPGTPQYGELEALRQANISLHEQYRRAEADYQFQTKIIASASAARREFRLGNDQLSDALGPLEGKIQEREGRKLDNFPGKLLDRLLEVWLTAAKILLAIVLVPIGIKALFYFVLAPVVSRRPPICLLPEVSGSVEPPANSKFSAVSQSLPIDADHELLVHSQYLQSMPAQARTDTKWLLDGAFLLTSLASGMTLLTRIRADQPAAVVVSSTRDPLSEIGVLCLPEGSAFVFHPRNLVGVLARKDRPLRITSHWRLGSLHAWLTLQLRYLAFHGPATLIVKGCRGIRVEKAEAGRAINQAATLGFSANVLYSSTRCETFLAYFRGHQPLFNDRFAGASGYYVYEEVPGSDRKSGVTGRGLEGFTDSAMKVFGL